ncbi:MFS transporter [Nocardia sp. NRRL S-836]|uniref:MFS transporter n=1 Tax=Nocardia sp. NRRL S-836 TaxID=1519492 RepID=UPI0006B05ECC|nr:MFS transporter [Nocardia sp. NRRL S-836]KOV78069.1 MFS transporter [Nocardia sp. NRRL S-836]
MQASITTPAGPGTALSRTVMWALLGLVLLADALDMIDATVTTIAAPSIVGEIGGGPGLIKWLGAAYALAMAVLLVIGGRLGDRYGQRRLFLIGMTGFTLASALCGLAPTPVVLVVARVLQGAFGALLIPQGMAIITRHFTPEMRRTAFNLFGPLLGIATIAGPVLAGFLIEADLAGLSWRPIFLVNLVLGTVGVALAARLLPRDNADRSVTVDGTGAGLLAIATFGAMFGLIEGSETDWGLPAVLSLVAGALFLALFARRQRTAAEPLIKPSLFRNRGFVSGLTVGLMFFAVTNGLAFVLSLFVQQALGASPGSAAVGMLPLTLGIIVGAGAGMGLAARMGRALVLAGMLVTLAGGGWLLALVLTSGTSLTLLALAPAGVLAGIGMGACFGTIFDITIGDVAPAEAGSASGTLTAVQQLATALGSATVTTVYLHGGAPDHAMALAITTVMAVTALCLPLLRLLPKAAPRDAERSEPDAG